MTKYGDQGKKSSTEHCVYDVVGNGVAEARGVISFQREVEYLGHHV